MSRQILPCWAAHARMGHNTLYGYAEPFAGTSIVLTVPAIEGDDQHGPLDEEVHVLPMEGPAFYGFEVLTEDGVRARLASKRPWKPRVLLAPPVEEDAVEVPAYDPALDCKPLGTLLREFSEEELEKLPDGSRFEDVSDGDAQTSHGFECSFVHGLGRRWISERLISRDSDGLKSDWGSCSYRLTRIGPAEEDDKGATADPYTPPAAAVGQRVFLSRLDRLTETVERVRASGWYLVTEVATTAGVEGAPIVIERLTGQYGDPVLPRVFYVLTLTEWQQNIATVKSPEGAVLFDEVPF